MQGLSIVKVWYQNDWGRYGRRDERLTRAFLEDPRVAQVVHLAPALCDATLHGAAAHATDPTGMERQRAGVAQEDRLTLFTPTYRTSQKDPGGQVLDSVIRLLESRRVFAGPSLLWVNAPSVLGDALIQRLGDHFTWLVTELEDDHRHYHTKDSEESWQIERRYDRAVRTGDLLVSNSEGLLRQFQDRQPDALHLPNAVDATPYENSPPEPAWLRGVPRPRLTYVGNLRLRLRADLVRALLDDDPRTCLVFCGDGADALREAVGDSPRMLTPGPIPWQDVPGVLAHSDVLLMPHTVNEYTDAMDPQKLYEYLASGRPVVATPVAGARDHGDVLSLASTPEEFVAAVREALTSQDRGAEERRRLRVRDRSWTQAAVTALDRVEAVGTPGRRRRDEQAMRYYEHDRPELRRRVPEQVNSVLDVGCGAGAVGWALRRRGVEVTGIELDPGAAARARERLDEVYQRDAVEVLAELPDQHYDAVLMADLLEHLVDPAAALKEVRRVLVPGGTLLACLPNLRHWSVLQPLLEGEFQYQDAGILDRTHLRFFTRQSGERLLQEAGFEVDACDGLRWDEGGAPSAVTAALRSAGLELRDFEQESGVQQFLWSAHATAPASAPEPADVSVIIPVCNALEYTRRCLDELQRHGSDRVLEVLVVDNGSTDGPGEFLASRSGIQVLTLPENLGFAAAVNRGVGEARGEYVCVLNNDTLLTSGWLPAMRQVFERCPGIGMVGPCSNYAKGAQQLDWANLEDEGELRRRVAEWTRKHHRKIEDVAFLSGFCFLAPRALFLEIGALEESYGVGTFEDSELCRRMRRDGHRLVIARDAFVYHFGNRTFRTLGIDLVDQQKINQRHYRQRLADDSLMAAQSAYQDGDYRRALGACRDGLLQHEDDLDCWRLGFLCLLQLDSPETAGRMLSRYLGACPDDPLRRLFRAGNEFRPSPPEPAIASGGGTDLASAK